jgi:hypothetical protein
MRRVELTLRKALYLLAILHCEDAAGGARVSSKRNARFAQCRDRPLFMGVSLWRISTHENENHQKKSLNFPSLSANE